MSNEASDRAGNEASGGDGRARGGRARRPVVAVTGAAGAIGARVTQHLAGRPEVKRVVAIDAERPAGGDARGTGVSWRIADVRDPALASKLAGCDVVVHLALELRLDAPAVERRALNVRGTTVVLTAAAAAGVQRVVLVTSAMTYGARPDNPVPLRDDAPVQAEPDDSLLGDLVEIERLARRARRVHPWLEVTVLRPAALVGPGVDSVITRHFEAPRLLVLKGSMPLWQFCHVDDLVTAIGLAALGAVTGSVNVACAGWLQQEDVERLSGLRRIELPPAVAIATAERLHRVGVTPAAASELELLVHPWVVATDRLAAAGWRPVHDNESALRALLDDARKHTAVGARRLDRGDAARAAAGATVALVGTAALVRRARRRRHG
ncbi:MAG: NAD-dependent epimerase/dehydratase family protein [Frankiaceae bacterium]